MIKITKDISPRTHYYKGVCEGCCEFMFTGDEIKCDGEYEDQYGTRYEYIRCPQCKTVLFKDSFKKITREEFDKTEAFKSTY